MALLVLSLALLLAMASHSDATYCLCNTGTNEAALQRNIDYACGNGADCSAINQNGACYNPNTVRDHCNYAVNSYYQRRSQAPGSCDFSGTAVPSQNPPSGTSSGCVYQSSPSSGGGTTGTPPTMGGTTPTPPGGSTGTTPPGGSTGTTPPTGGGTTTPAPPGGSTNPGGMTPGAGSTTNPGGMTPGTIVPSGGTAGGINTLGPSGSGLGPDYSASVSLSLDRTAFMLVSLLLSGLVYT